jgi:hypothetical protein
LFLDPIFASLAQVISEVVIHGEQIALLFDPNQKDSLVQS